MIEFEGVSVSYNGSQTRAVEDLTMSIGEGEFVFLVGKSGAGKSTVCRLLLREVVATSGTVSVLGEDIALIKRRRLPYYRRKLGVVFQEFRLIESLTVHENVSFALEAVRADRRFIRAATPSVLNMVGLRDKARKFPGELSGGEQQRVAIARAIANNPRILLCDEPTGNLDPQTSAGIMNLLADINSSGTTVVMATHDITMVDRMRMRVISLENGRISGDRIGGYYG